MNQESVANLFRSSFASQLDSIPDDVFVDKTNEQVLCLIKALLKLKQASVGSSVQAASVFRKQGYKVKASRNKKRTKEPIVSITFPPSSFRELPPLEDHPPETIKSERT